MTRRPTLRRGERLRWRHGPSYVRAAAHAAAAVCYSGAARVAPRGKDGDLLAFKAMTESSLESSCMLVALAPHFHRMRGRRDR